MCQPCVPGFSSPTPHAMFAPLLTSLLCLSPTPTFPLSPPALLPLLRLCTRPSPAPLPTPLQVKPLRKQLKTLRAWITGQRKDQSPGTRADVPVVQVDPVFEGVDGGKASLVKYNPLSNMTSAEVWNFLRVMVSHAPEPGAGSGQ